MKDAGFKASIGKYTDKYTVTAINDYVKYSDLKVDDVLLAINDKSLDKMTDVELKRFLNDYNENLIRKLTVYRPHVDSISVAPIVDSQNSGTTVPGSFPPISQQIESLHITEPMANMNASPINSSTPMRPPVQQIMMPPSSTFVDQAAKANGIDIDWRVEDIRIMKINGAMGLSIVGGGSVACHPFGINEPGIFISKIVTNGAASRTSLRVGDRLLKVNGIDVTSVTHDDAVDELKRNFNEVLLTVRHDPQPLGLKEIILQRTYPEETLGIRINGGVENKSANPSDPTDEGIFVIDVSVTDRLIFLSMQD